MQIRHSTCLFDKNNTPTPQMHINFGISFYTPLKQSQRMPTANYFTTNTWGFNLHVSFEASASLVVCFAYYRITTQGLFFYQTPCRRSPIQEGSEDTRQLQLGHIEKFIIEVLLLGRDESSLRGSHCLLRNMSDKCLGHGHQVVLIQTCGGVKRDDRD